MVQIIWTELALNELEHIKEYISFDSVVYAKNVIQKIRNKTKPQAILSLQLRIQLKK